MDQQGVRSAPGATAEGGKTKAAQPPSRPANTRKWVYFFDSKGQLWRRKRRWVPDYYDPGAVQEMMTRSEHSRRVMSPSWSDYKPEEEYEADDAVPEWHGGGADRPDVVIDMNEGDMDAYEYVTEKVKETHGGGKDRSQR